MEEQKKRNWAEDDSDEWEEPEAPSAIPTVKPDSQPEHHPRPNEYGQKTDLQSRLATMAAPYLFELSNLPFSLDSEDKLLPHLIAGLATHDIEFRSFSECPRGCARLSTKSLEVAKHLAGLDGTMLLSRALWVNLGLSDRNQRGGRRGRRGEGRRERGDFRSSRGDGRRPQRPIYPAVIENKNSEYIRKDIDVQREKPKPAEVKTEVVQTTPVETVPVVQK